MASVTQTIPSFTGGISEQPDQLKFPGQVKDVTNAIPDITRGLYKRPGAKRVGTTPLANVQSGGSWFHYHRDEEEGSYIGQVAADGQLRMWKASGDNAGAAQTIVYGTGGQTAIQNYLATSNAENIQFLTINDTTFVSSRDSTNANTLVGSTGTTTANPDNHFAFLEVTRTENGRQYGLNLYNSNSTTSFTRATRLKIQSDTLDEGPATGQCRGIGIQTFSVDSGSKKNLIFKLDIRGQQGNIGGEGNDPEDFACAYNRSIILLHGGENWTTGDTTTVTMDSAKGRTVSGSATGNSGRSNKGESSATYTIEVLEHETVTVKANLGLVRPEPTPFDADTAVSADQVLGGIISELPGGITGSIIGNGIYLSSSNSFNCEIVEDDLMRSMGTSVNDVTLLPKQCKHGYIVKIANARISEEDDYYLRFEGLNDQDGTGSWTECAKPGIAKSLTNMPLVIQRTSLANGGTSSEIATFTIKQFTYADREVGDDNSNPFPTFKDKRINKVLFFRNRLAVLAGENVILSRPGTLGTPDFFAETALTVSANLSLIHI